MPCFAFCSVHLENECIVPKRGNFCFYWMIPVNSMIFLGSNLFWFDDSHEFGINYSVIQRTILCGIRSDGWSGYQSSSNHTGYRGEPTTAESKLQSLFPADNTFKSHFASN
jgi:hypothetical protein